MVNSRGTCSCVALERGIGEGPETASLKPSFSSCSGPAVLPILHSCKKIKDPFACTASVT